MWPQCWLCAVRAVGRVSCCVLCYCVGGGGDPVGVNMIISVSVIVTSHTHYHYTPRHTLAQQATNR